MSSLIPSFKSKGQYKRPTAWGTCAPLVKGEEAAFAKVKKGVLGYVGVSPSQVHDFTISFRSRTATFTNSSGQREEVDLLGIKDPKVQATLEKYYDIVPGARKDMQYALVSGNSKGDRSGQLTLQRTTEALKSLPKDLNSKQRVPSLLAKQSSKEARHVISRRHLFVEYFLGTWKEKIQARVDEKQKELKDSTLPDVQALRLRKELKELRTLQQQLQNMDMYALSQVLEHIPVGSMNKVTLDEIAKQLEQTVLKDIKSKKWVSRLRNFDQAEITYAKDVVGMLYQGRKSYFEYCNKVFGDTKQESVGDIFFREAIKFAVSQDEYTGEGFKDSILLANMGDELKKEVQDDLHGTGVFVNHAIAQIDSNIYADQTEFTENATDKEKALLQDKKMKEAFEEHDLKINTQLQTKPLPKDLEEKKDELKLKIEDIPVPPKPEPGALSVVKTTAVLTLVAVWGAVLYDPQAVTVLTQYAYGHPGHVIAAITLIDSIKNRMVSFFLPRKRNPENGRIERRTNYQRIMKTAAAAVGAGVIYYFASDSVGAVALTIAQVANYFVNTVWKTAWVQLPYPIGIPWTNITLIENIPMVMALQFGTILNKIPVINEITKPVLRALTYTATASGVVPLLQYGAKTGYEFGKSGAENAYKFWLGRHIFFGGFKDWSCSKIRGICRKLPRLPKAPLTIM